MHMFTPNAYQVTNRPDRRIVMMQARPQHHLGKPNVNRVSSRLTGGKLMALSGYPFEHEELGGLFDKIRGTIKKIAAPVTKITEKILKPIVKPLRPVGAAIAPFTTGGIGLFVQPKFLGIKSESSQKIFDKSQQATRIVAAVAATVVTAGALAPVMGAGGAAATGGTAAAVAGGVGLLPTVTPVVGISAGAKLLGMGVGGLKLAKDFLIKSGVAPAAAGLLAQQMLNGERPVPYELEQSLQSQQAGMFGMDNMTLAIVGVGIVGAVVMMNTRGGIR